MTNENGSKFYFRVEDIKDLLKQDATHIIVNAETGEGGTGTVALRCYDASAAPKGEKPGCPWPCGGGTTDITPESLENARKALG